MEFAYDGGGLAKGGDVTLFHDGEPVGTGRVGATQPMVFSADETTDIGYESGTTVSPDYTARRQPLHRQDPLGAARSRRRTTTTTSSTRTSGCGSRWPGSRPGGGPGSRGSRTARVVACPVAGECEQHQDAEGDDRQPGTERRPRAAVGLGRERADDRAHAGEHQHHSRPVASVQGRRPSPTSTTKTRASAAKRRACLHVALGTRSPPCSGTRSTGRARAGCTAPARWRPLRRRPAGRVAERPRRAARSAGAARTRRQVDDGQVAVGLDPVAAAVAGVVAGGEVADLLDARGLVRRRRETTRWSRSTSMSSAMRWVTWNVISDSPTALS